MQYGENTSFTITNGNVEVTTEGGQIFYIPVGRLDHFIEGLRYIEALQ
jgi:uncharacterized cupin superfamily protein